MDKQKRRFVPIVLGLLIILTALLFRPWQHKQLFKETRTALYTQVSITVLTPSEQQAKKAIEAAYDELSRLGLLLNFYADDSEISLINQNAGVRPVKVAKDTLAIIQAAIYVGDQTEGGFDVTVGPLVKLWDFNKKTRPTVAEIEKITTSGGL